MRYTQSAARPALSCILLALIFPLTVSCQKASTSGKPESQTAQSTVVKKGALYKDVPERIDASARYLFYLHGRIIENEGIRPTSPQHGVYEYEQILDTFVQKGFIVISEARPKDTDVAQYAAKVVRQIKALLAAGVPAQKITVVGASKGGGITVATSSLLKNRDVNFVILAGCGDYEEVSKRYPADLWGNVLSIYDVGDEGLACSTFFDKATGLSRRKELVLKMGLGHGLLYKPYKEWVDPAIEWAMQ